MHLRQAGVLAACGLIALEHNIDRLADDHRNARRLAEGIAGLPGIDVDVDHVPTNMVYFNTDIPAKAFVERLAGEKVYCLPTAEHRIRLVTHLDVDHEDIDRAVTVFRQVTA